MPTAIALSNYYSPLANLEELKHYPPHKSPENKLRKIPFVEMDQQVIPKAKLQPVVHNFGSLPILKKIAFFFFFIFFTSASHFAYALENPCNAPPGSYSKTCSIQLAQRYKSTDPILSEVDFCVYEIKCKKAFLSKKPSYYTKVQEENDYRLNKKIFEQGDIGCLSKMENCDGHLIVRYEGNDQNCVDPESLKNELKKHNLKTEL